jgi:hypothetical protein
LHGFIGRDEPLAADDVVESLKLTLRRGHASNVNSENVCYIFPCDPLPKTPVVTKTNGY